MTHQNLSKLGEAIRLYRKKSKLTLQDIANKTGLSNGLLSKIENARSVPSLPVLINISKALTIPLSDLLKSIEAEESVHYLLIKSNQLKKIKRENTFGYQYETIFSKPTHEGFFEAMILTLENDARGKLVTTDGDMLVHVLDGRCTLQLDHETIQMDRGDTIYFNGKFPHMSHHYGEGKAILFLGYFLR